MEHMFISRDEREILLEERKILEMKLDNINRIIETDDIMRKVESEYDQVSSHVWLKDMKDL